MGSFADVELDDLELAGPRLVLRRWQPADAAAVHAIMADESMYEFLPLLPRPYTLEVAREYVEKVGHEGRAEGTGVGCAVVEKDGGRLVGAAAVRHLAGQCDVGYWVAPAARGHGYAAEAVQALAEWALGHGVPRVELLCEPHNLASVRTAMASGFAYEGVSRAADARSRTDPSERIDVARFARLPADSGGPIAPQFPWPRPGSITDGVLDLRPLAPADGPAWREQEQDEGSTRYSFTGAPPPPAALATGPQRAGLEWLVGRVAQFAIEDTASGRFAGSIQIRAAGPPGVGGIGYTVHPAFRGRGYTARALRLLAPWAFETAGFARLELGANEANIASQRAAASGGFEPDGVRRARMRNADGTYSDEVRFALINPLARR